MPRGGGGGPIEQDELFLAPIRARARSVTTYKEDRVHLTDKRTAHWSQAINHLSSVQYRYRLSDHSDQARIG